MSSIAHRRLRGAAAVAAAPLLLALAGALVLLCAPSPLRAAPPGGSEAPREDEAGAPPRPGKGLPPPVAGRQRPRSLFFSVAGADQFRTLLYEPPERLRGAAWKETGRPQPLPVLFFSGEFGWTPILQDTASRLALKGRYVLAIDTSAYFAQAVPEAAIGRDLETFRAALNKESGRAQEAPVLAAGFSYGASMLPYVVNRAGTKGVQGLLLIAPSAEGATVFRVAITLHMPVAENERIDVAAEISRLPLSPVVVLEGESDDRAGGRGLVRYIHGPRKYVPLQGADHQFHNVQPMYLDQVENSLVWLTAPPAPPPEAVKASPGGARPDGAPGPAVGPGTGGVRRPPPREPAPEAPATPPGDSGPPGSSVPPGSSASPAPSPAP